ncbi:putative U3 small nucleolar RNA-associated protein 11 [Cryptotermes secundus]|uniref:U3 small nucleolar RNA-associated protein 11 n=1 Tax=Cryptotermes secundus TaxID=105785 RepID=A0A2J7PEY7_9NEOP|nr:probable U3 small nucleolar RNA-associated protein 11 [Cryptotermes secundus]XP_023725618.1 probable U3 small nucleolar RNA-associated protein 11 [Cryptotermes secundus]XP_033611321.1 probable U3 small nucleolar RNA-associated protein 11 [Cryptotermes secundus]XP_033611322.1 probable U3 small nucleolar RNA-associated protein 11 [Cryptotermes secundus]PNF14900.1 putative U3 small nucleolar RNA-associated protein 11 [Cryptotermes secundus]
MSSWKKVSKTNQRTHRERHQPASRAHLGLLEKKKDYRQRAKDHNEKQRTLKLLKRRALNRNPDEFYFHMINSRVEDGEHKELDKDDEHTPDQIHLMQSQDLRYVSTKRTMESRKINRLQSYLHLLDAANQVKNKHIFFVDTEKEAKQFDLTKQLDTHPALLKRRINRLRTNALKNLTLPKVDEVVIEKLAAERDKAYMELQKRIERERELTIIQQKLEIKRHLLNKKESTPKRIKPSTKDAPPVYMWKYERKR